MQPYRQSIGMAFSPELQYGEYDLLLPDKPYCGSGDAVYCRLISAKLMTICYGCRVITAHRLNAECSLMLCEAKRRL